MSSAQAETLQEGFWEMCLMLISKIKKNYLVLPLSLLQGIPYHSLALLHHENARLYVGDIWWVSLNQWWRYHGTLEFQIEDIFQLQ